MQFSIGNWHGIFTVPSLQSKIDLNASPTHLRSLSKVKRIKFLCTPDSTDTDLHTNLHLCPDWPRGSTDISQLDQRGHEGQVHQALWAVLFNKWTKMKNRQVCYFLLRPVFSVPNAQPLPLLWACLLSKGRVSPDLDLLCWHISLVGGSNRMQDTL